METPVLRTESIDLTDLRTCLCMGVAGNFAGHLEQAGEARDFANVSAGAAPHRPKGIFPWYVPDAATQLATFPLSSDVLALSNIEHPVQIEPELAVLCDVVRDERGVPVSLVPRWVAAFDDCSIRRPGARRISDKKNWGAASKGLSSTVFVTSDLAPDGALSSLRLASFLRRGSDTHTYGVDTSVSEYMLSGDDLLAWLIDRLNAQRGSDDTPLEDVGAMLAPETASILVGVGATRYEPFGETTYVAPGDEAIVVLYDESRHTRREVAHAIAARRDDELAGGASVLRRVVVADR